MSSRVHHEPGRPLYGPLRSFDLGQECLKFPPWYPRAAGHLHQLGVRNAGEIYDVRASLRRIEGQQRDLSPPEDARFGNVAGSHPSRGRRARLT
jgi:hypothetical protein